MGISSVAGIQVQRASLFGLLSEIEQKPQSRSAWEDRFAFWQQKASQTEGDKIEAASNKVRRALNNSTFLSKRDWQIIPQGSYSNRTNVRTDSDVDLCVCLNDAFFIDGPPGDVPTMAELGNEPLSGFNFQSYKTHIAELIKASIKTAVVTVGGKAIHINRDETDKVSVDVVPTFTYKLFKPRTNIYLPRGLPDIGVGLLNTEDGNKQVTNFPEQHKNNGIAKNLITGRRYKRVVRILKKLKIHIADNFTAPDYIKGAASRTPSFLIECLVYNCPNQLFGNPSIYDDVINVLNYLCGALNQSTAAERLYNTEWKSWYEVNGIKLLFRNDQAWTQQTALSFAQASLLYIDPK